MDAYILFFILILALFLGFAGLEVPIIGLIGTAIALGVIVPNVPALIADSTYMMFAVIVVFSCGACSLVGKRRTSNKQ